MKLSEHQRALAIAAVRDGKRIAHVARDFGVNASSLWQLVTRRGIRNASHKECIVAIAQMHPHLTREEIVAQTGAKLSTVNTVLWHCGLKRRSDLSRDDVGTAAIAAGLTIRMIEAMGSQMKGAKQ